MKSSKNARGMMALWAAVLMSYGPFLAAEDWPTYQHDNRRSGVTSESLNVEDLAEQWVHKSPYAPQPAWHGPAKWDAYARIIGLRSMRNYDPAFHITIANDSLYFASSTEDCITCLDASTGDEKWSFITDGPVRIAPACANGKLYFGSDDGHAYCITADTGALVWKYAPVETLRLIPNDGKLISEWPCRTGVLIDNGKAYFAMSLFPFQPSYLCAADADTGKVEGPGLYCKKLDGVTIEGAMLASPAKLYAPQGRSAPMVFNREDGAHLGNLEEGGGGIFALLTPDFQFAHGPGNKTGWITISNAETHEKIALYHGGNGLVVSDDRAYVLKDTELTAINRANSETVWTVPSTCPHTLILAGDVLFAGGNDEVTAFATADGQQQRSLPISGRAYGLAVANGALFATTDTGAIHCFRP